MSGHTISRIANVLHKQFDSLIDMSDCLSRPTEQRQTIFLHRSLAALCIKNLTEADPVQAANAVTDGFEDGCLDAIFFDQRSDSLFIVQAKWSEQGTKAIDVGAANGFVAGVRDLLTPKFERFNDKVKAKESEIRSVLYSERNIRIRLIVVHTSEQSTPNHVTRSIDEFVQELNVPVPIAKVEYLNQAGVYDLITSESAPAQIKLQIGLNDWGQIERPFLAYYGRVHIREVAQWWAEHENALFSKNLRLFYFRSEVNDALQRTLITDPENFWYFNNGITIICNSIVKNLAGAPYHKVGIFTCDGVSIVNGAQTVGTIGGLNGQTSSSNETDPESGDHHWVQVRLISLERCPPDFASRITRAANLQNAVGSREFAAMDPLQHRLSMDFALDRRRYAYKSGEPDPKGDEGCTLADATQALACAHSMALAVQVKREIGQIWADTNAAPYSEIFNSKLTSTHLWRSVLVMRAVDEELQKLKSASAPRADMIGVHMNRVILHLVFKKAEVRANHHDNALESALIEAARRSVHRIFSEVAGYLEEHHPSEYLASLCKNLSKCEELDSCFSNSRKPKAEFQEDLFAASEVRRILS